MDLLTAFSRKGAAFRREVRRALGAVALGAMLLPPSARAASVPAAEIAGLSHLDGSPFKTEQRKLVLYFWASWCPSCIQKLSGGFRELDRHGAALVAVNTDSDLGRVQHVLDRQGIAVEVAREKSGSLRSALGAKAVPFWAVLAREKAGDWRVVDSEAGGDMEKLQAAVARAGAQGKDPQR